MIMGVGLAQLSVGVKCPYIDGKMSDTIDRKILKKTGRGWFTDQFCHPKITLINPPPPNV
jgi:hypothetical protein